MNRTSAIATSESRMRFSHDVDTLLNRETPGAHSMMTLLDSRSDSFTALREEVIDYYFNELPAHPTACADAMRHLVVSVVETIQQDLAPASSTQVARHN